MSCQGCGAECVMLFDYKEVSVKNRTPKSEHKGSYCFNCFGAKVRAMKKKERIYVEETV